MTVRSVVLMMLAALTFNLLPHPAQAEFQKLLASDGAAGDYFGWSVSIDGDTAVVGAIGNDEKGDASGAAYVFVRSGTGWIQQTKLTASAGLPNDSFGFSVSVYGDTVLVGCNRKAYVFVRSGNSWMQQAKLTAPDGQAFGASVALFGDTAVIGTSMVDTATFAGIGSAYVFVRSGTIWTQQAKLTASDGTANDLFGFSVSLSGDTAVIAASSNGGKSGLAYVFVRSGTTWTQQAKLILPDSTANDAAFFWWPVSVSGNTAVIAQASGIGCAYVYTRSETTWTQQEKLTPPDDIDNGFGWAVSASGDIAVITVPAYGIAYVFVRSENTWMQQVKLTASDSAYDDSFGFSVAVSGKTAIIGARDDDDNGADSGSAYIINTDYSPTKAKSLPATLHLLLGK